MRRGISPIRIDKPTGGILTFNQIREERRLEKEREEERRHRQRERLRQEEEERRRREEDKSRRLEEEKLRLEREELRREREKLEREKQELLRFERERQRLERERLQREKDELERLRRQQVARLEEARRATKRPVDVRDSASYYDDRKRSLPDPRSAIAADGPLLSGSVSSSRSGRNYEASSSSHGYEGSRSSGAMFTTRGDERVERSGVRPSYDKPSSDYGRSERDHRGHVSSGTTSSNSRGGAYASRDPWAGSNSGSGGVGGGRSASGPSSGLGAPVDWSSRSGSSGGNVGSSAPIPRPPILSGNGSTSGRGGASGLSSMPNPFMNAAMGGGAPGPFPGAGGGYGSAAQSDRYDAYKSQMSNSKHY